MRKAKQQQVHHHGNSQPRVAAPKALCKHMIIAERQHMVSAPRLAPPPLDATCVIQSWLSWLDVSDGCANESETTCPRVCLRPTRHVMLHS